MFCGTNNAESESGRSWFPPCQAAFRRQCPRCAQNVLAAPPRSQQDLLPSEENNDGINRNPTVWSSTVSITSILWWNEVLFPIDPIGTVYSTARTKATYCYGPKLFKVSNTLYCSDWPALRTASFSPIQGRPDFTIVRRAACVRGVVYKGVSQNASNMLGTLRSLRHFICEAPSKCSLYWEAQKRVLYQTFICYSDRIWRQNAGAA